MRSAFSVVIILSALVLFAGSGVCGDTYFEGWEGGTTAGWEAANASSDVTTGDAGGNPGGCLLIRGDSDGTGQIGGITMTPGATGDYWASGVGLMTFDMSFDEGWYSRVWLRIRSNENISSAWSYNVRMPNEPGGRWRQVTIEFDQAWSDYDAQLVGWSKQSGALSFQETMANVYAVEIVVIASDAVDVSVDNFRLGPPVECIAELPAPVLVFKGKSATNDFKIRWDFEIENWSDFSPELFLASPTLPPCGSNKAGPRSYIKFVSARGQGLGMLCGLTDPEKLQDIYFVAGNIGSPDIYIELIDRRCGVITVSNVVSTVFTNEKPLPDAGDDRIVECGGGLTTVTVDGSGSSDPDGDDITFEWFAQGVEFDDPSSVITVGHFPMGTTQAILKVFDGLTFATDVVEITIEDKTPPALNIALSRSILWPPNHKFYDIRATVTADDACGEVASIILTKLFDEGDENRAAGEELDWVRGLTPGALDTDFQICAERCGNEGERRFGLVYTALDRSLNIVSDTVYVCVPHDRSGHAYSSMGFSANGRTLDENASSFVLVVPSIELPDFDLDAGSIDLSSVHVSNTRGAVPPVAVYVGDVDGDGRRDMVFRFLTAEVTRIRELAEDKHEPVSFYCEDAKGQLNAVPDIFDLGKPISILPSDLKLVEGKDIAFEKYGPRIQNAPGAGVATGALIGRTYPNPFNPTVSLDYALPETGEVRLFVYDVNGRLVRRLVAEEKSQGTHTAVWNARDDMGESVSSGVYFARLRFGRVVDTRKIVLLK